MFALTAGLLFGVSTAALDAANPQALTAKAPAVGLRLTYTGKLEPTGTTEDDRSARSFRLTLLVTETTASGGCRLAWVLEEGAGGPRWSWSQKFGTVPISNSLQSTSDRELPAIQAERDGSVRTIALRLPHFAATDRLKSGAEWDEDQLHFQVVGVEQAAKRKCWKVAATSNLGPREVLWVDEQEPLIVKHRELVFLGQGVAHELSLDLEKAETLPPDELARHSKAHASLVSLRGPVKDKLTDSAEAVPAATPALLDQSRAALAVIQNDLKSGVYADLAKEIVRDTQSTINRQDELEKIRSQVVGKQAKEFSLPTTRGVKFSSADLKGKPLVLHFWEYRSEPKIAPYGETGYLDFIVRQREKQGVRIVGIAVDDRLRDEATRPSARKDIRAFCDFMNLSYPVAFDEGTEKVIDLFGDPRRVGGKLPLFVVIAPDGTVSEYHAGLWGSTADEGLKELDQRLQKLVP